MTFSRSNKWHFIYITLKRKYHFQILIIEEYRNRVGTSQAVEILQTGSGSFRALRPSDNNRIFIIFDSLGFTCFKCPFTSLQEEFKNHHFYFIILELTQLTKFWKEVLYTITKEKPHNIDYALYMDLQKGISLLQLNI